jgi:hypothetical protein
LAVAQDFGVMGSAETINRGNFKLMANPIIVFQDGEVDNEIGISLLGGYGFTDRIDGEARFALFDNVSYVGGDLEYWLARGGLDFSVAGGFHAGWGDETPDTKGIDVTLEASGHVRPRLEVFGALDLAFNSFEVAEALEDLVDDDYTTAHLVPGIEFALSNDVDFLTELGIGLNDDSSNYLSIGIAYYLR